MEIRCSHARTHVIAFAWARAHLAQIFDFARSECLSRRFLPRIFTKPYFYRKHAKIWGGHVRFIKFLGNEREWVERGFFLDTLERIAIFRNCLSFAKTIAARTANFDIDCCKIDLKWTWTKKRRSCFFFFFFFENIEKIGKMYSKIRSDNISKYIYNIKFAYVRIIKQKLACTVASI